MSKSRHDWKGYDRETGRSKCLRCGAVYDGKNGTDFCAEA